MIELTDPEIYVPDGDERYSTNRRYRYNPDHGYIADPLVGDQPTEQFLEVVDIVLSVGTAYQQLRAKTADRIRTLAQTRKRQGLDDLTVMTEVARCIVSPDILDEKGF